MKARYEYEVVNVGSPDALREELVGMAKAGWKLVQVIDTGAGPRAETSLVMERPAK